MARKQLVEAVAYFRTSSATNVGDDKDSDKRQRVAIERYAKRHGFVVVDSFYDDDVKGSDRIEARPGFAALLNRISSNGVRTVLVEDETRFSRDLVTQELGVIAMINLGVKVYTAGGVDMTETEDPFKIAMRQIGGAFSQLEKSRLVSKLKAARDRKRDETGKCGGRRSYVEMDSGMVALAKRLHRYPVNNRRRTLRDISAELFAAGHCATSGAPFGAEAVRRMLAQA